MLALADYKTQELNNSKTPHNLWERIKRLKLRHFGKLKFTYDDKLRQLLRHLIYCGSAKVEEDSRDFESSTAASRLI